MDNLLDLAVRDLHERFGVEFQQYGDGRATGVLRMDPAKHHNMYHIPYGGIHFHLADLVAGIAAITGGGVPMTVSSTAEFLRGSSQTKALHCSARVEKPGKAMFFVDAEITDDAGTLLSRFHFIFKNNVNWHYGDGAPGTQ